MTTDLIMREQQHSSIINGSSHKWVDNRIIAPMKLILINTAGPDLFFPAAHTPNY